MAEGIKLHLGCGDVFRPGYVNVDRYDSNVADVVGDIMSLPFATASADRIEAFHVIEHFDLIHCKYLLSEWFRVLKRGRKLVLEMPDLDKTYKEFVKSDSKTQERKLSWIFGIDSPGMLHKAGFSFELARRLLSECGFEDVRRLDPSTHLYEAGMRIECVRSDDSMNSDFSTSFRRNLIAEIGTSDSYILVPLEKHVNKVLSYSGSHETLTKEDGMALAAMMAPVRPSIAIAIIKTLKESSGLQSDVLDSMLSIVRDLRDRDFHCRAFSLWVRRKKEGDLETRFQDMMQGLGRDVLELARGHSSLDDAFSYLLSLDPMDISLMDFDLVLMDARARLNTAIKMFAEGDLDRAMEALELAAMENPDSPYVHWNLARLGAIRGMSDGFIEGHYERAVSQALRPEHRNQAKDELTAYRSSGRKAIPRGPITEY